MKGAMLGDVGDRIYRLVLEGEFSDNVGSAFHFMSRTRAVDNTVLTGNVRDQAELQGSCNPCRSSGSPCSRQDRSNDTSAHGIDEPQPGKRV